MDKDIIIKDDVKKVAERMDLIIRECLPITQSKAQGITEALVLAKGVSQLREIFLNDKSIKATVLSMQDTRLGFLTDRSYAAVEKSKKHGKKLTAYTYGEVAECCIEALLKGYRLTDNEFNIIAGNFYGAQNGEYRHIIETEGLTDFTFANTMPVFKTEARIVKGISTIIQYAEVQCYATWKRYGKETYIGHHPSNKDNKDILIFKIKTNEYMGDDGVVGKALSKLFKRIRTRLSCKLFEESTDIELEEIKIINETPQAAIPDKIQNVKQSPPSDFGKAPVDEAIKKSEFDRIIESFNKKEIYILDLCAYFGVDKIDEMDNEIGLPDLLAKVTDIESGKQSPQEFKEEGAARFKERLRAK